MYNFFHLTRGTIQYPQLGNRFIHFGHDTVAMRQGQILQGTEYLLKPAGCLWLYPRH